MGKIFANEVTDKGLISKICKQLMQLNIKKNPNNPIQKWAEDLHRQFSKEDILIGNKHMKRCSTPLGSWRNENQNHNEYYFMPMRIAISKKRDNNK